IMNNVSSFHGLQQPIKMMTFNLIYLNAILSVYPDMRSRDKSPIQHSVNPFMGLLMCLTDFFLFLAIKGTHLVCHFEKRGI
ncbi:MAG: hypothetical protein JSW39_26375, partial [Desulfobacterales bacterium]